MEVMGGGGVAEQAHPALTSQWRLLSRGAGLAPCSGLWAWPSPRDTQPCLLPGHGTARSSALSCGGKSGWALAWVVPSAYKIPGAKKAME